MIYLDIVRRALGELTVNNAATRRDTYQQLRDALTSALDEQKPPPSAHERTIETRLLEMTIRQVEGDVRAGVDVMSEDYQPPGLISEQTRLYAMKAAALAAPASVPVAATPEQKADATARATEFMETIKRLSYAPSPVGYEEKPLRLGPLFATLIWTLRNQTLARGSLGLLWLIMEPMLLVAITVSAYLFVGARSVLNMPLVAFAVTGIIPWLMMRITMLRIAQGFNQNKDLLGLPAINMQTIAVATAIQTFLIFSIGLTGMLMFLVFTGDAEPPHKPVEFILILICLCLIGTSIGVIVGSYAIRFPILTRFLVLSSRILAFTSSVFILSEQFPADYKHFMLFNPLSHGFQSLRSAYFVGYDSTDANLGYFLSCFVIIVVAAFVVEYSRRPLLKPA